MRKSFDGLFGIIKSDLNRDVRDGGLFMFLDQRLNRLKILYWDTDGIAIWMTRLEQGCFQRPLRCADGKHVIITHLELQCILSGVVLAGPSGSGDQPLCSIGLFVALISLADLFFRWWMYATGFSSSFVLDSTCKFRVSNTTLQPWAVIPAKKPMSSP